MGSAVHYPGIQRRSSSNHRLTDSPESVVEVGCHHIVHGELDAEAAAVVEGHHPRHRVAEAWASRASVVGCRGRGVGGVGVRCATLWVLGGH